MKDRDLSVDTKYAYIIKAHKEGKVSDEYYCEYMLTVALTYWELEMYSDALYTIKAIGIALIDEYLKDLIEATPEALGYLEDMAKSIETHLINDNEYVFNGPRGTS